MYINQEGISLIANPTKFVKIFVDSFVHQQDLNYQSLPLTEVTIDKLKRVNLFPQKGQ